jgi:cytochrome c oxidase assembly factor CtaG
MSETLVLPFLVIGLAVGVAAGGLIWLRARRGPDAHAPSSRDFRTLFASGAALFSAGVVLNVVFGVLGWAWYVPVLILVVGLINMSVGLAKRREWQHR